MIIGSLIAPYAGTSGADFENSEKLFLLINPNYVLKQND
jgi:hypothetical protein